MTRKLFILFVSFLCFTLSFAQTKPEATFWTWFQRNEAMLFDFERDQEHTFDLLANEMHKVHPDLTFEFGPKEGGRRDFVISADGIREAFPKVESLFASAPKLAKWRFIKFRPRREPFDLTTKGITIKANLVTVLIQPDGHKAGLTVFIPGYARADHNNYATIAFLLLDQALGEYDVETKVGFVNVQAPSSLSNSAYSLKELPKQFDVFMAQQ